MSRSLSPQRIAGNINIIEKITSLKNCELKIILNP